jgi:hypothetical protein
VFLATLLVSIFTARLPARFRLCALPRLSPVSVLKDEALSTPADFQNRVSPAAGHRADCAVAAAAYLRRIVRPQPGECAELDPGFDPNHVLLASYDLDPMGYRRHRKLSSTGNCWRREGVAGRAVGDAGGFLAAQLSPFTPMACIARGLCAPPA